MSTLQLSTGQATTHVEGDTEVDELEEEITCAVCQEHFDDPKILPCLHYYCKRCVQALIDTAASHDKKTFPCPECRVDTVVPNNDPQKLPTAFFVNRMKAVYSKMEKTQGKVKVQCEQCFGPEASAFCRQCAEFICVTCTDAHKRMKAFSSHRVSTLEDLREGSLKQLPAEKPPAPPTCTVHDEELLKMYCYDCDILICRDCILIDHKRHKYEFVKKVVSELKVKLTDNLVPLKKTHTSLSNALKLVEHTKSDIETSGTKVSADIKRSFQRLHDVIERRKDELLNQTSKFVDTKFDRLSVQEKELQTTATAIQGVVEFVERSLENMTDEELVGIHAQIQTQIREETRKTQALNLSFQPVEENDIKFDINCIEELKRLCREKASVHAGVKRKVVWVDPKVNNHENSSYVNYLKGVAGVDLFATTSASKALSQLLEADPKIECRAITAGTGGKEFVESLRSKGIQCPVLVFCASFDFHSKWARKFKNVEVAVDTAVMFDFATWENL